MNNKQFLNLVDTDGEDLISMYLSTHRFGQEVNDKIDALALKVLIRETEAMLQKRGKTTEWIQKIMLPLVELVQDRAFWNTQLDGLAIFLSNGKLEKYSIPVKFTTSTHIGRHFYIKPLISLFNSSAQFYLTKLTKNKIQFYLCDMFRIREVKFEENFPDTMDKALPTYEPEMSVRIRSGHAGANPTLQGQGTVREDDQIKLRKFYEKFDAQLNKLIGPKQIPMVLAGLERLVPVYRGASKYPAIVEKSFMSDPNAVSLKELHKAAYNLARETLCATQQKAFGRFMMLAGSEKVSSVISKIITASYYKDVDVLFLQEDVDLWGSCSDDMLNIEFHPQYKDGDENLSNLAAIYTLRNGGDVYVVPSEKMPLKDIPASSLLRASVVSAI